MMISSKSVSLLLTGVCSMAIWGCGTVIAPPDETSSELEIILASTTDFETPADSPLVDSNPGDVVDGLDQLDGCWGAYYTFTPAEDQSEISVAQVFKFDTATGAFAWHVDQQTLNPILGLVEIVVLFNGTYSVDAENTGSIQVVFESATSNDPDTGNLVVEEFEEGSDSSLAVGKVTVSGNAMIIDLDDSDSDEDSAESVNIQPVFVKFDCPAAE